MRRKMGYLCLCMLVILGIKGCSSTDNSINSTGGDIIYSPTMLPNITSSVKVSKSELYQQAIDLIKAKHYPQAIGILKDLGDYQSSGSLLKQLRYMISGCYISNGQWAVGAITSSGGVAIACESEYADRYSEAKEWSDIRAICFRSGDSIEGLTHEGKIITTNAVTEEELLTSIVVSNNACAPVVKAVTAWSDIEYFQDHYPQSAVALTKNGSVYSAASCTDNAEGILPLAGWKDIIAIADGGCYVAGLQSNGTVIVKNYGCSSPLDVSEWDEIVAITAGAGIAGLREDGTVVSTEYAYNIASWTDIIAISTDNYGSILGLKSDGTVVATASVDYYRKCKVSEWSDIVAIDMGCYFSIGLKSDGTMVLAGDSSTSGADTPDLSSMKDLYVPQIKYD